MESVRVQDDGEDEPNGENVIDERNHEIESSAKQEKQQEEKAKEQKPQQHAESTNAGDVTRSEDNKHETHDKGDYEIRRFIKEREKVAKLRETTEGSKHANPQVHQGQEKCGETRADAMKKTSRMKSAKKKRFQ